MSNRFYASRILGLLAFLVIVPNATAEIASVLVSGSYGVSMGSSGQYEFRSVSMFVDPTRTNWIAWADSFDSDPPGPPTPYACTGGTCIGRHGFGTDDFIRMTITNPSGTALTLDIDKNDSSGVSDGQQAILFGTAEAAPDVRRYIISGGSAINTYFDEAGAFNSLFSDAGNYTFDFSFQNSYCCSAGHANVYLLADVNPVPEPEIYAMLGVGLGLIGWASRRRKH